MPTKEEYASRFDGLTRPILQQTANTKRDVRRIVSQADKAVRAERLVIVREISDRWKERFAEIKTENDEWQAALAAAYKDELIMNHDAGAEMESVTGG